MREKKNQALVQFSYDIKKNIQSLYGYFKEKNYISFTKIK